MKQALAGDRTDQTGNEFVHVSEFQSNEAEKCRVTGKCMLILKYKEEKITVCSVHFGVHLKHLENLLNVTSGTSLPRDLNTGGI